MSVCAYRNGEPVDRHAVPFDAPATEETAKALHGLMVPFWSDVWPQIGSFQRKGLLRVVMEGKHTGRLVCTGLLQPGDMP